MAYLERESGKKVYFEDHGAGDSAIVLVHGWGMGVRTWDYSLPQLLAAGHRVVLMDHRGCGQSDKDFKDMGIQAIADDLVSIVQSLDLKRVVLNGWSLGGAVVIEAARQLGDLCVGVVLTCGATPCYLQKADYPHGGTDEALADTMAAMAADRVNFLAGLSAGVCASEVSEEIVRWMWAIFMQASPTAAQALGELGALDQRGILGELSVPILSFVGGQDAVVDPNVCRSVAEYNSAVKLVECSASGHAPFIEEGELYHGELLSFLSENL